MTKNADPMKDLLLALARGRLGDFVEDRESLSDRRVAIAAAIEQGPDHPLRASQKNTLKKIDDAIGGADEKIETLGRLIAAVEQGD